MTAVRRSEDDGGRGYAHVVFTDSRKMSYAPGMGNFKRTSEEDYRHYARPAPGSGESWVEIIDDGTGRAASVEADQATGPSSGPAGNSNAAEAGNSSVPAHVPSGPPVLRRRNLSLWTAWVLVALSLVIGFGWLFGLFVSQWDEYLWAPDGSMTSAAEASWLSLEIQVNLSILGPYLVFAGLLGAIILLAVQAAMFGRSPGKV